MILMAMFILQHVLPTRLWIKLQLNAVVFFVACVNYVKHSTRTSILVQNTDSLKKQGILDNKKGRSRFTGPKKKKNGSRLGEVSAARALSQTRNPAQVGFFVSY